MVLHSARFGHRLPVDGVELLRQMGRYRSAIDGHYLQVELPGVVADQLQVAQREGMLPTRAVAKGVTGLYALVAAATLPMSSSCRWLSLTPVTVTLTCPGWWRRVKREWVKARGVFRKSLQEAKRLKNSDCYLELK